MAARERHHTELARLTETVGEREGASELIQRLDGFVEDAGARADYSRAWVGRLMTFLDGPVRASLLGADRRRALVLDKLYRSAECDARDLLADCERLTATVAEWRRAALQARADLLAAPVDLGLPANTAWVEWSSQANTIRMIDRLAEGGEASRVDSDEEGM